MDYHMINGINDNISDLNHINVNNNDSITKQSSSTTILYDYLSSPSLSSNINSSSILDSLTIGSTTTMQPPASPSTKTEAINEQITENELINQMLISLKSAIENNCTDLNEKTLKTLLYYLNITTTSSTSSSTISFSDNDNNNTTESSSSSSSSTISTLTTTQQSSSMNNNIDILSEWLRNETISLVNGDNNNNDSRNINGNAANYELTLNDLLRIADTNDQFGSINDQQQQLGRYCPSAWDGASCWMRTLAGNEAIIPCFSHFNGIEYDTSQNATRMCLSNGTWAERADYGQCKALNETEMQIPIENVTYIYYFGYCLSLLALSIALFIFLYFKDLRCVRNIIHTNLMATYLLIAICWIITDRLHTHPSLLSQKTSCITVILLTYLMGTNFFWMFVEGLYLYILVVKTFSIEFVKITNYLLIGWATPAFIIVCWILLKFYFTNYNDEKFAQCPYQAQDEFDNIYKVPILLVLIINIFFLGKIMWVLITKLRTSNSIESKQRRKAAKALLVLIPLLGVGYMFVLVTPEHPTAKWVFQYSQALLVSTQGFTVAVLYCFCNGEVRNSLRNHFQRFRLRRTLCYGGKNNSSRRNLSDNYYYSNNNNNNINSNNRHHSLIVGDTGIVMESNNNHNVNTNINNILRQPHSIDNGLIGQTSELLSRDTSPPISSDQTNPFKNNGGQISLASTTTTTYDILDEQCTKDLIMRGLSINDDDDDGDDDHDNRNNNDDQFGKNTISTAINNNGYQPVPLNDNDDLNYNLNCNNINNNDNDYTINNNEDQIIKFEMQPILHRKSNNHQQKTFKITV